jgi:multiple sugar transport system substrate-binding protein
MNRAIVSLVLALLMALAWSGSGESAAPVTVRVWTFLKPSGMTGREKALKQIITDFEAANPGIKVQVEPIPYQELPRQFAAAISAKNGPDIVWLEAVDSELIQQGAIADMAKLFEAEKGDFFPDLYRGAGYGETGKVYGMVLWPSPTNVIFYRKDLFREAKIPVPLKTWDDFISAAQKLTNDRDKDGRPDVWGFGFSLGSKATGENPFQIALMELQGTLFDVKNRKAKYTNDHGVKAMTLMTDFVSKYKVTPKEVTNWTVEEKYEQFSGGRFAMINGYGPRFTAVQSKASGWKPEEMGVMRWPSFKGDKPGVSFVGGWQVAMWSGSQHKTEAGKFVQALFGKSGSAQWVKVGGQLPARLSLLKDPFFEDPKNLFLKEQIKAMESPAFVFLWPGLNMTSYQEDIHVAAQKIILQGADVLGALKEAEDAFNKRQR